MTDVPVPLSLVQDPFEQNVPGFGFGRDPMRTPMPWTPERHGGFTSGQPWLPLGSDVDTLNVLTQTANPRSMLSLYQALIRLRRESDVLSLGGFRLTEVNDHLLTYERRLGDRAALVVLNMTDHPRAVTVAKPAVTALSTYLDTGVQTHNGEIALRPNEGLILQLSNPDAGSSHAGNA